VDSTLWCRNGILSCFGMNVICACTRTTLCYSACRDVGVKRIILHNAWWLMLGNVIFWPLPNAFAGICTLPIFAPFLPQCRFRVRFLCTTRVRFFSCGNVTFWHFGRHRMHLTAPALCLCLHLFYRNSSSGQAPLPRPRN